MAEGGDYNVGYNSQDFNMPKWKKDLIERRKITTKTLSGNLQISCPTPAKFSNSNSGFKGLLKFDRTDNKSFRMLLKTLSKTIKKKIKKIKQVDGYIKFLRRQR